MNKKQLEEAVAKRRRVKIKEGGKTVFGRLTKVVGNSATIKKEDGELVSVSVWDVQLAE